MIDTLPGPAADDLTGVVLRRFAEARTWAATRAPYLASALFALTPVVLEPALDDETGQPRPDPQFRAFPADTRWHVHLDPGTALVTPSGELGWWLLHHIGHLVRHHAARSPVATTAATTHATGEASGPDSVARRWNQAADAEVNDDLEADGLATPAGVISPRALGLPPGRLAEEYQSLIEVLDEAAGRGGRRVADLADCGSAVDGIESDAPDPGSRNGLDPLDRDLLELVVARQIEQHAASRSPVPAGWRRWAAGRLHPAVDWRITLGAALRRGIHQGGGRVHYTYTRPSHRRPPGGAVLPSMIAPQPELVLVVDTSGSIPDDTLAGFLAEVTALATRAAGPRRRLRVICCDQHAHPAQTIRRPQDVGSVIDLVGGGGTDLREGIVAATALRPRPDLVVVLTDGDTPWPDHRPPTPVVIGLVPTEPARRSVDPPSWAQVVPLPATADRRHAL